MIVKALCSLLLRYGDHHQQDVEAIHRELNLSPESVRLVNTTGQNLIKEYGYNYGPAASPPPTAPNESVPGTSAGGIGYGDLPGSASSGSSSEAAGSSVNMGAGPGTAGGSVGTSGTGAFGADTANLRAATAPGGKR